MSSKEMSETLIEIDRNITQNADKVKNVKEKIKLKTQTLAEMEQQQQQHVCRGSN